MELSFILSVRRTIVLFVTFAFSGLLSVSGQYRETPMPGIIVSSRIHGYWEHLPAEYYANPTKKYPLILYIHGVGEVGDGSPASLPVLLGKGIPQKIESDVFPAFVYNIGIPYAYIVLTPQYTDQGVSVNDIDAMLNYAF